MTNPANPASPLSPLNPANPAHPINSGRGSAITGTEIVILILAFVVPLVIVAGVFVWIHKNF